MKQEWIRQLNPEFEKLPATWKSMQDEGVTPETRLKLGFSYSVPTEEGAQEISTMLRQKFSYEVRLFKDDGADHWSVKGSTGETTITLEILRKWISYMVQAGVESGCQFEGWGATKIESGGK